MSIRLKILLLIIPLSLSLCIMSNTYSRYVADTTGNVEMLFAKWQILVKDTDITNNTSSSIILTPVIDENKYITKNKIAPSSTGYFDIDIDPSNVEVSFNYNIKLNIINQDIPDLIITKYSILSNTYVEGDKVTQNTIENNEINDSLDFLNNVENFKFKPFTVRIYFEWYEGQDEKMNDLNDTLIGINPDDNKLEIKAEIKFEQKINTQV